MIHPYITFSGECRQALMFYQQVFQAEPAGVLHYGEYVPDGLAEIPKNLAEWIMHGEMNICGVTCWFADEVMEPVTKGTMVKLTLTVADATEAQRIFEGLKTEGYVTLLPTETFYSTFHAGVIDRFGVSWNITAEEVPAGKE